MPRGAGEGGTLAGPLESAPAARRRSCTAPCTEAAGLLQRPQVTGLCPPEWHLKLPVPVGDVPESHSHLASLCLLAPVCVSSPQESLSVWALVCPHPRMGLGGQNRHPELWRLQVTGTPKR